MQESKPLKELCKAGSRLSLCPIAECIICYCREKPKDSLPQYIFF